jgi:hypothetical protein
MMREILTFCLRRTVIYIQDGEAIKHIVNTSLCTTSISVRSIMQRAIEFHINFMDLSTVRASGKYECEILACSIVGQRLAAREKRRKKLRVVDFTNQIGMT